MKRALTLLMALALLLGVVQPALSEAGEKPSCFIPEVAAQFFNRLLEPAFRLAGAADSQAKAEQYSLTKASVEGKVLYLSAASGKVELNNFFRDGQPDTRGYASTVTLAVSAAVPGDDLTILGKAFADVIAGTDGAANKDAIVDWMAAAVDTDTSILPMNGYTLAFVKNDNGSMFSLISNDMGDGGGVAVDEPEPEPTPEPEPEPTPEPEPEPTPEPTEPPAPTQAPALPDSLDNADISWNGVWAKALRYKLNCYKDGKASIYIYFRVLNNSDQSVTLTSSDATVDGVPVKCGYVNRYDPHTDTGNDPPSFLMITSKELKGGKGDKAIACAKQVKLTLKLLDENYDEAQTRKIVFDLSDMKGERDDPPDILKPTPAPKKTAAPKATQKPSGASYRSLCKGDKGDDVKRMQQKLIDLGFLSDVADGEFGPKTAAAVKAFNEANGLGSGTTATAEMQKKLFSGSAKGYEEAWIPVELPRTEWKNLKADGASYRVKISNVSKTKTIKGIALQYYVTDVWGNRLWGDSIYREFTDTVTIKPGKSKWSLWWYMSPSWYSVATIHFRVAKVAFSDGTVHENYDGDFNWTASLH